MTVVDTDQGHELGHAQGQGDRIVGKDIDRNRLVIDSIPVLVS